LAGIASDPCDGRFAVSVFLLHDETKKANDLSLKRKIKASYPRYSMKRFIFYLVLIPLIGPLIKIFVLESLLYPPDYPFSFMLIAFNLLLLRPGIFLLGAYIDWLLPAIAIAIADRFVRSAMPLQRLGIIAAVGFLSTLLNLEPYVLSLSHWQWGMLVPPIACAIAAIVCHLALELKSEHRGKLRSTIRKAVAVIRAWPDRI
jgi:hypothetical protein